MKILNLKLLSLRKKEGFTLIEALVAFALFSIILAAIYSTFFMFHKAIAGLDKSMLKLQEGRTALDIIRREIESSFYKDADKNTLFRLEDRDEYGKQTSRISFTSMSSLRAGLSEIKYFVKETDGKMTLYKGISTPFGLRQDIQEADIIEDIGEFLIEAKYGNEWVKTWDSSLIHKLPEEIRISLKFKMKERDILLSARARPMIT